MKTEEMLIEPYLTDYTVMIPTINEKEEYSRVTKVNNWIIHIMSEYDIKGLYFLYNNGELVYIGVSTKNIYSRIQSHLNDKEFDSYTWCATEDKNILKELCELESVLIKKYKPIHNSLCSIALKTVKVNLN